MNLIHSQQFNEIISMTSDQYMEELKLQETLQNLNELKLHKKDFQGIKSELDLCYHGYTNKETIINILQFWIFSIRALHSVYDAETVKIYLRGNYKDFFNFSVYHEFGSPLYDIKKKETSNKLSWFFNLNIYSSKEIVCLARLIIPFKNISFKIYHALIEQNSIEL